MEIPKNLLTRENEKVLTYLAPLSCHSDTIMFLDPALHKYSDIKWFCPNPAKFHYCFYYVNNKIFAFGVNMGQLGLRLPSDKHAEAIHLGFKNIPEAGEDWYEFPFDVDNMTDWVK